MLKRSFALGAVVAATAGALITGAPAAYAGEYIVNSGTGDVLHDTEITNDDDTANAFCGGAVGDAQAACEDATAVLDESNNDDSAHDHSDNSDNSNHDHSDHSDNSDNNVDDD